MTKEYHTGYPETRKATENKFNNQCGWNRQMVTNTCLGKTFHGQFDPSKKVAPDSTGICILQLFIDFIYKGCSRLCLLSLDNHCECWVFKISKIATNVAI